MDEEEVYYEEPDYEVFEKNQLADDCEWDFDEDEDEDEDTGWTDEDEADDREARYRY